MFWAKCVSRTLWRRVWIVYGSLPNSAQKRCFAQAAYSATNLWDIYRTVKAKDQSDSSRNVSHTSPSAIFANNQLELGKIDVYGFDYDYTLAVYTKDVNLLIYELALAKLIDYYKYPSGISEISYDPTFAIRGLHYDVNRGLVLKLDAFCQIQLGTVYQGKQAVSDAEVRARFNGTHIPRQEVEDFHVTAASVRQLMDFFSLPELGLISNVTEFFQANKIDYNAESLFHDVEETVRSIHLSGQLYSSITSNLNRYVHHSPELRGFLERLRAAGKVTFLLTNSPFPFIDSGMNYLIGKDWRSLFTYIIVRARKPSFFEDLNKPFRLYSRDTHRLSWSGVARLETGQVYAEGNVAQFLDLADLRGRHVLYFGDHVYSDLAEPVIKHGWRTAAIVPELRREIMIMNSPEFRSCIHWQQTLTALVDAYQDVAMESAEGIEVLNAWLEERDDSRQEAKAFFNAHFGSVFRTFHNPTYFTRRLMRFADIYTAAVPNFQQYSLQHTFYPRRTALPHEPSLPPRIPQ